VGGDSIDSPAKVHPPWRVITGDIVWPEKRKKGSDDVAEAAYSLAEVGEACGYPDAFHFSRLFKREIGIGPRAYRKQGLAWFSGSSPAGDGSVDDYGDNDGGRIRNSPRYP
jgi:AraC-like DNA-binding protein